MEWFYITFHKTDRLEYVHSGRKLHEETLQTLTEYSESIYDTGMIEIAYSQSQHKKVRGDARQEARHDLQKCYTRKMRHFANERRSGRLQVMQQNNDYYGPSEIRECREHHYNRRNDRSDYKKSLQVYRTNPQEYSYKRNPQERGSRKSPQEHNKGFKPCRLHGEQANHTYKECCQNPCIQAESKSCASYYNNKRA